MTSLPTVSVIIPLYNGATWILECLESVHHQTYHDLEIVVVDDGSTDHGPTLVREFGDPRVRLVSQANRGLAGARNSGVRHARGRYLAFLDADDAWAPEKLEHHVAQLDADPSLGVSFSHSAMIDEASKPLPLVQSPNGRDFSPATIFCRNPIGNGSAPVLRRSVFDHVAVACPATGQVSWFDESFRQSEDVEMWTRIAATTRWRFDVVPLALTLYRIRPGALSADVEKQLATWHRFREKVATYAPALVDRWGLRAEAYQLRYLARRAVQSGDRQAASRLIRHAIVLYPSMLFEEPMRTLTTLVAALSDPRLVASLIGIIAARRARRPDLQPRFRV